MPIFYCPNCDTRITVGFDVIDYIHTCDSGNPAIDQEDVVVTGNWEDYTGTGSISPQEVMRQGLANELQGRRAGIMGEDKEDLTRRGVRQSTHRQRQHLEFINLKNGGLD